MRQSVLLFLFVLPILFIISLSLPRQIKASSCGAPIPPATTNFKAVSGPNSGQVTLFWDEAAYANRYAVAYGLKSNNYIYGADNIGGDQARSFTVASLHPGVRYYFRLAAARDCSSSPFSAEVSAVAAGATEKASLGPQPMVGAPKVAYKPAPVAPVTQVFPPIEGVGRLNLKAASGPRAGQATLFWQHADSADDYHLIYGRGVGIEEFGALNIGRVNSYTVTHLVPSQTYYFALVPIFNNRSLYTSAWVKAVAKQEIEIIHTTPDQLAEPKKKVVKKAIIRNSPTATSSQATPSPSMNGENGEDFQESTPVESQPPGP